MSFQTDIQPILQASCVSCHNSGFASGGVILDGYENVKPYAQSGKLSKVINHENGVTAMPMNADKLDDCTIKKIDAWIEQGFKDN
jgi:mono/diheme cytochrome c family protein